MIKNNLNTPIDIETIYTRSMETILSTLHNKDNECVGSNIYERELRKINLYFKEKETNTFAKTISYILNYQLRLKPVMIGQLSADENEHMHDILVSDENFRYKATAFYMNNSISIGSALLQKSETDNHDIMADLWDYMLKPLKNEQNRFNFIFFHEIGHLIQKFPFTTPALELSDKYSVRIVKEKLNYVEWFKNLNALENYTPSPYNKSAPLEYLEDSVHKKEIKDFIENNFTAQEQERYKHIVRQLGNLVAEIYADCMSVMFQAVDNPDTYLPSMANYLNFRKRSHELNSIFTTELPKFSHDTVFGLNELAEIMEDGVDLNQLNLEEFHELAVHCSTYGLIRYIHLIEETDLGFNKLADFCASLPNCKPIYSQNSQLDMFHDTVSYLTTKEKFLLPIPLEEKEENKELAAMFVILAQHLQINPELNAINSFYPKNYDDESPSLKNTFSMCLGLRDAYLRVYGSTPKDYLNACAYITKRTTFENLERKISPFLKLSMSLSQSAFKDKNQISLLSTPSIAVEKPKTNKFLKLLSSVKESVYYPPVEKVKFKF